MSVFDEMTELLYCITKALVDFPDEVHINGMKGENTYVFEVDVVKEDVGKVIGRGGNTAHSIRNIMNSVATKHRIRCLINFLE
jgi:predicted RNA-binding protein YlqC (UPF0109 family)